MIVWMRKILDHLAGYYCWSFTALPDYVCASICSVVLYVYVDGLLAHFFVRCSSHGLSMYAQDLAYQLHHSLFHCFLLCMKYPFIGFCQGRLKCRFYNNNAYTFEL